MFREQKIFGLPFHQKISGGDAFRATPPRVSVAMCTWNGERFVQAQLDSLAAQTLSPAELVVSDDASSDGTVAIVKQFARTAPFEVRLHRNPARIGYIENFLLAASMCHGDIIAFCDQDDVWADTKLERCAAVMRDQDVLLVVHVAEVVDEHLEPTGQRHPYVSTDTRFSPLRTAPWDHIHKLAPGFAMVFRRSLPLLFLASPLPNFWPDSPTSHDDWTWFLASVFGDIVVLAEPLALYRRHDLAATRLEHSSSSQYLRRAFQASETGYSWRAGVAHELGEVLEREAPGCAGGARDRARDGATYYRRIAQELQGRARLYEPRRPFSSRFGALRELVAKRAYRRRTRGGLGVQSLVKDVTFVLLGERLVFRRVTSADRP